MTPRVWTDDEVREQFLNHCAHTVAHWLRQDMSEQDRMTGAIFSVLVAIDGCSAGLPGFVLSPDPHPTDEQFHRDEGENWYPSGPEHDIGGGLHEHWHTACRRYGVEREPDHKVIEAIRAAMWQR